MVLEKGRMMKKSIPKLSRVDTANIAELAAKMGWSFARAYLNRGFINRGILLR